MSVNTTPNAGYPVKSVGLAYLLWFFFGILGVHHFYLGKIGRGVGYFFTLGWCGVGWLIDAFTLPAQVRMANMLRRGLGQAQAQAVTVNLQAPPETAAPTQP